MPKRRTKTKPFDAADYLDSPEMVAAYLTEAFETDDPSAIAMAIGAVARSGPREYYDPRDGRGLGAREFAWSALVAELADPVESDLPLQMGD